MKKEGRRGWGNFFRNRDKEKLINKEKIKRICIISLDKAAEIAGLTLNEMMQHAVANGIKSEETADEFREGLKALTNKG